MAEFDGHLKSIVLPSLKRKINMEFPLAPEITEKGLLRSFALAKT